MYSKRLVFLECGPQDKWGCARWWCELQVAVCQELNFMLKVVFFFVCAVDALPRGRTPCRCWDRSWPLRDFSQAPAV